MSRPIAAAIGLGVVATALVAGVVTSPRPPAGSSGPVVYYEALGAHEISLLELPLDGAAQPRLVARRPSTGEGVVRFEVDPTGSVALVVSRRGEGGRLEAVAVADGRTLWQLNVEDVPSPGVWSSDGRRWASLAEPQDGGASDVVVVDVAAGTVARTRAQPGLWPQGFTMDGDLVLTEEEDSPDGRVLGWRFHVLQRATGGVIPIEPARAATGPRAAGLSDVATQAGWAVRRVRVDDPATGGSAERLELVDLRTGTSALIGPAGDTNFNWFGLAPDAARVLVLVYVEEVDGVPQNALLVIDRRGEGAEIWRGASAGEEVISTYGHYLAMNAWVRGSLLTVVHLGTGRSVEIPLPPRIVSAAIRAVVDPVDVPLIAVAPLAPEASAVPTAAAAPLAGAPLFVATSGELEADGRWVGRVSILAPGEGGGVAVVATMPPLGAAMREGYLSTQSRPGSDELLVEIGGELASSYWLWDPGHPPVALALPDALPPRVHSPRWRPDGAAIAFQYEHQLVDRTESGVAILDLDSGSVRAVELASPYRTVDGWAADGQRLLLHHDMCIEGCGIRLSYLAWFDVGTGAVVPFGPNDHDAGFSHLAFTHTEDRTIVLSSIELDATDDVVLHWPKDLPFPEGAWIDWSADREDLHLGSTTADVVTLYRVPDVFAGGAGDLVAHPTELGRLPAGLIPYSVSPDAAWAIAADRAYTTFLVRLSTGEGWEIRPVTEGQLTWLPAD